MNCVWKNNKAPCDDDVRVELLFSSLEVPMCRTHLQEQKKVMSLHASGVDIEVIVDMSQDERDHAYLKLKESGFDVDNVKL